MPGLFGKEKVKATVEIPQQPEQVPQQPVWCLITDECSFTGNVVDVRVGTEVFHLHDSVLCRTSEYFKTALKPVWNNNRGTEPIDLSEESSDIFQTYVLWLYAQTPRGNYRLSSGYLNNEGWENLAKAYVLGEKIMDASFQHAIIDEMIAIYKKVDVRVQETSLNAAQIIYEGTTAASPARRLMVDFIVSLGAFTDEMTENEHAIVDSANIDKELVDDILCSVLTLARTKGSIEGNYRPWVNDPQKYKITGA